MSIFRALCSKEYSPRMLTLTGMIVQENPGNYTVWKVRLDTLLKLTSDFGEERAFLDELALENPKCYQIWRHRQSLAELSCDPNVELDFINRMLDSDSKNYHAWSYRQWLVKEFDMWKNEVMEIERFITNDIRNNSAWNQRYYVVEHLGADFDHELDYVSKCITIAPHNESPWNYIKGIRFLCKKPWSSLKELALFWTRHNIVPFALSLLLDIYKEENDFENYSKV